MLSYLGGGLLLSFLLLRGLCAFGLALAFLLAFHLLRGECDPYPNSLLLAATFRLALLASLLAFDLLGMSIQGCAYLEPPLA